MKAPARVVAAVVASAAALPLCANSAFGWPMHSDPPILVPWSRVGDISLGEPYIRVAAEYGRPGHGFQVWSRSGGTLQGVYTLHGSPVQVTFQSGRVSVIDFSTPYYRTASGFGIGSLIPPGKSWHGFLFHKTFPGDPTRACNCWFKIGNGPESLPLNGTTATSQPAYFLLMKRGRVTEIDLQAAYA